MTYEVRTQTIALDEHELRSIRRWMNQMVTVNGRDIHLQRAPGEFERPAYVLKEVDRKVVDRGRSMTMDQTDWQIEVLAKTFWDVKREVAEIRQRLLQVSRIPLYLWGWSPPDIWLEELPGAGSLPAGEVSAGITAVNNEDEESMLSTTAQITVALNSAVRVVWTPWPRSVPVAKEFNVYAGAATTETLEVAAVAVPGTRKSFVFTDLAALAGGGASPPSSSIFFANRYLRVPEDQVASRTMEHPALDDVFNGFITFRTEVESVRIARPGVIPDREIGTVTIDLEVQ